MRTREKTTEYHVEERQEENLSIWWMTYNRFTLRSQALAYLKNKRETNPRKVFRITVWERKEVLGG